MSRARILNDVQERDVAISYFCGVSPAYIKKKWNVNETTVISSILHRRSRDWRDPLVESYRSSRRHALNFSHFLLAYEDMEIPDKDLVDPKRDRDIYRAILNEVLLPLIERISSEIGMEYFMESHTPIENLLSEIFGKRTSEMVIYPVILKVLFERFNAGAEFSFARIEEALKANVVRSVKFGGLAVTPNKEKLVSRALGTLSRREAAILESYFGLRDEPGLTLVEIGRRLGLTKERVRQIKEKAIRKLGHTTRSKGLRIAYGLTTEAEVLERLKDPAA